MFKTLELKRTISEGHSSNSIAELKRPESVMFLLLSIVNDGIEQE